MAYRVIHQGATIEADTVGDVRELLEGLNGGPSSPPTRRRKTPRWASPGALDGRIIGALKDAGGTLTPRELATEAKTSKYALRVAVKDLVARKLVRAEGSTANRRYVLTKSR